MADDPKEMAKKFRRTLTEEEIEMIKQELDRMEWIDDDEDDSPLDLDKE